MCGIFGTYGFHDDGLMKAMDAALRHRGPDGDGVFVDDEVALGHRRLSIIDIVGSPQPIHNESRDVWLVFNGEIYNFENMRRDLISRGHQFYTDGDGEVIVHAYEEFGTDAFAKLDGIFAFALWDRRKRTLYLVRDRMGIKPLYFHGDGSRLVFASELQAIIADPHVDRSALSAAAIRKYLLFRHTPGPDTVIAGVRKVEPGTFLELCDSEVNFAPFVTRKYTGASQIDNPVDQLRERLRQSVHMQMVSDVPVGILLSAGIDSSAIVALAAETGSQINTFTAGFADSDHSELDDARRTASYFGTTHTELTITNSDLSVVPRVIAANDEPVAGPSSFAYYLMLEKLREQNIKVVLLGHGADEACGGYEHLAMLSKISRYAGNPVVGPLVKGLLGLGASVFSSDRCIGRMSRLWSDANDTNAAYKRLYGVFDQEDTNSILRPEFCGQDEQNPLAPFLQMGLSAGDAIMAYEMGPWLADDLLHRVDRMCMTHSIEGRVPFLSNDMVDFAYRVPGDIKRRGGQDKALLRQAMQGILPADVCNRSKRRFTAPMDRLMGPAFLNACDMLFSEPGVLNEQIFDPTSLKKLLSFHRNPSYRFGLRFHPLLSQYFSRQLWTVFTFYLWHKSVIEGADCSDLLEQTGSQ